MPAVGAVAAGAAAARTDSSQRIHHVSPLCFLVLFVARLIGRGCTYTHAYPIRAHVRGARLIRHGCCSPLDAYCTVVTAAVQVVQGVRARPDLSAAAEIRALAARGAVREQLWVRVQLIGQL